MENNNLKVLFEDNDYLVIEKPAGITVNRSDTTSQEITLQDLIDKENKIDKSDPDHEFIDRGGIVHRLDKETSGVLIVAKNSTAFRELQRQFKERIVEKTYLALSHGEIKPEAGEINVPVGRLPWNRKRFGVIAGGRESLTRYEIESYYKFDNEILSLVRLYPKTGRTHQIRVHLKHIGYPIFGDPFYGGRKVSISDRKILPRIFLHAESIIFLDPKTQARVSYKSDLPDDLNRFLKLISSSEN